MYPGTGNNMGEPYIPRVWLDKQFSLLPELLRSDDVSELLTLRASS